MRDIGLYEAMEQAGEIMGLGKASVKIRPFVHLIQELRKRAAELSVAELIQEIIDEVGYKEYLQDNDDESAEDRMANVDELITKAVSYQNTHDEPGLTEFLSEVALVADIDNVDGDDDRVLLMTLHSAKGLEFPNVYLSGMEENLFPSYMTVVSDDPMELEEERRLAYVGITRAMNELTLTCAKMRMVRGETQYNMVSRFVMGFPVPFGAAGGSAAGSERRVPFESADVPKPSFDYRPRAVARPRTTAKADKPYIAQEIGSLNRLAGISRGAAYQVPEELAYGVGDRVQHVKYGEGKVLNIEKEPRDYKVTVLFDRAGQKIMYAAFAKLKRL